MSDTAPARSVLAGRVAAPDVAGGMAVLWVNRLGTTFRSAWYTLTNRRAIIATGLPFRGRSLKSDPITPPTVLVYEAGAPSSIMFNRGMRRRKNGHYRVDVGFERIENGAEVYRMTRQIQEGQAA